MFGINGLIYFQDYISSEHHYTTPAEYEQCLQTLPAEWAAGFRHYYKLFKKDGLQLATDVRKLLDEARITAVRKIEMQTIQEPL